MRPDSSRFRLWHSVDVRFKDVTYETLNEEGFLDALRAAYPQIDWNRPFDEFMAR